MEENTVQEARASLKYARISARKVKIVADLIRGKDVNEALAKQISTLKESINKYVKEIEELKDENLEVKNLNEKLKLDLDRVSTLKASLSREVTSEKDKNSSNLRKIEELSKEIQKSKDINEKNRIELNQSNSLRKSLEEEFKKSKENKLYKQMLAHLWLFTTLHLKGDRKFKDNYSLGLS